VKRDIVARGEPLWMSDLPRPTASETQTAAHWLAGCKRLPAPYKFPAFFEEAIRSDPPSVGDKVKDIRVLVDPNRAPLVEVVELARHGGCRFPHDIDRASAMSIMLPECGSLSVVQELLTAKALLEIDASEVAQLYGTIDDKLAVADLLVREPFLISQMIRARDIQRSLDLLAVALARGAPPQPWLRLFDDRLQILERETRVAHIVRAGRACYLTTIVNIGSPEVRRDMGMMASLGSGGMPLLPSANAKCLFWGSPFYRPRLLEQQVWFLRTSSELAALIDEVGLSAEQAFQLRLAKTLDEGNRFPVAKWMMPVPWEARPQLLGVRQRLIGARLALRARAFFDAHGALPDSIDQLYDEHLDKPAGLLSGRPVSYEKTDNGFALFDVDSQGERFGEFIVKLPK
jgi:hypothetical protein